MRLKHRILSGFGALALLFVSLSVGGFVVLDRAARAVDTLVEKEFRVSHLHQDCYQVVVMIHSAVWDAMLLQGNARANARDELDALARRFYADIRELDSLGAGDVESLRWSFEAYYLFGSAILNLEDVAAFKSRSELVEKFVGNKRSLMDLLEQGLAPSQRSFEASLVRLRSTFARARVVVGAALAGLVLLSALLSVAMANRLTRPIEGLTRVAKEVAEGGAPTLIPEHGTDEVGTLALAFRAMLDRVGQSMEALRQEIAVRTEAERHLDQARAFLSAVLDSVSSVLVSVDCEGRVTQWNARAVAVTGVAERDALGRRLGEVLPELARFEPQLRQVMVDRQPAFFPREPWSEERTRWVDASLFPLAQGGGAVVRLDDVTELEKKDAQLRHVQRMDTVRILAGGLSHDFNNILAAIIGTVSLMRYDLGTPRLDPQAVREGLDTIEEAAARAAELVKNLLILSRKQELAFASVDLAEVLESTLKMLRSTMDKSIETVVQGGERPVFVRGDRTQLQEVLLNLGINAWHAMTLMRPAGEHWGGTLTMTLFDAEVDAAFSRSHPAGQPGRYAVLSVKDTGVGMDAATREHVFEPFFTSKGEGRGTGLGLAVSFSVVQLHGGFLDVYSEPGRGTEFKVYLPMVDSAAVAQGPVPRLQRGAGRVLLVDDEAALRKIAANILRACGYHVEAAADGAQALAVFEKAPQLYDLVVLDLAMPGLSGLEVFQQMRVINPAVRVLLQSGFGADSRVEEAVAAGAVGFIQKPYRMTELSQRVAEVIRGEGGTP